jgi:hypothetical protein
MARAPASDLIRRRLSVVRFCFLTGDDHLNFVAVAVEVRRVEREQGVNPVRQHRCDNIRIVDLLAADGVIIQQQEQGLGGRAGFIRNPEQRQQGFQQSLDFIRRERRCEGA